MKIELTEQEVNAVIKELAEIPFKYSNNLIGFFAQKLREARDSCNKPATETEE